MATEPVKQSARDAAACPYCGQALRDEAAIRHLRESERRRQAELRRAAREHAGRIAEELAASLSAEHEKNLERLERELSAHDEELIEERAKHRMVPF
jgi:DNA repair exonuclease SbcCD ATPase subunit